MAPMAPVELDRLVRQCLARDPDGYARDRVSEVLALPGVERATWWRNVYRDRPENWHELPEFDTLGVYECDPSFVPPPTPEGISGHHFLRTPRPGQGRLTGKPTVSLSLVLISPTTPLGGRPAPDRRRRESISVRVNRDVDLPAVAGVPPSAGDTSRAFLRTDK